MKRESGEKKTASPNLSIERLKDMPLKEYTAFLVQDMVRALNAKTKRKEKQKHDRGRKR
jgi:hypothetical protein